jgi:phosphoglucosamine mutase
VRCLAGIFGTSGIRGKVGLAITPELAMKVGQALASLTDVEKILIGRDTRSTSPLLEHALAAGITSCGAIAFQQGMIPTPVLAYLTSITESDAGVMITASHNPPEYNGLKLFNSDTTAYSQTQQEQIEQTISKKKFKYSTWHDVGTIIPVDKAFRYIGMVTKHVNLKKKWKIVLDVGNGATFQLAPQIFRELDCNIIVLNAQPDGHFPGRGAEPNIESLKPLCSIVRKVGADIGIAYDGDGDRMIVVDEKGRVTSLDQMFSSYATYIIRRENRKVVVTHVEASMCVEKMIEAEGGKVIRTKVGDVSITEAIRKHDAIFGGEPCGAWVHPNFHYCPDGILSSILLLEAMEETNQKLSQFVSETPEYPLFRRNIQCPNNLKLDVLKEASKSFPKTFQDARELSKIDGLRLTLEKGWLLIRPSGTEPYIRLTVEGETLKTVENITNKAIKAIKNLVKKVET